MATPHPPHPYYPPTLSLPDYVPPTLSPLVLCAAMGAALTLAAATGWMAMGVLNPRLSRSEKAAASWFLISALLHLHFESHFLRYRHTLASSLSLPSQLWKHYALSDSRYLSNDAFVVGIEQLTVAIIGPLCLLTWAASVRQSAWRHPARVVVCVLHAYGCALYFVTGRGQCRPEWWFWWVYLVGMNVPWIVVPAVLGGRSVRAMVAALEEVEARREVEGGERRRRGRGGKRRGRWNDDDDEQEEE
ncbi:Emopamil binding protein-domain-containing protein [Geopyxis carbonaria]|nr:Emopamil binding protein-domain-containing protein [Geopyxis carbonaria]